MLSLTFDECCPLIKYQFREKETMQQQTHKAKIEIQRQGTVVNSFRQTSEGIMSSRMLLSQQAVKPISCHD